MVIVINIGLNIKINIFNILYLINNMNTNITNVILNIENANSIITNNISSSSFFSDFDKDFFSVLDEVSRLDRIQQEFFVYHR